MSTAKERITYFFADTLGEAEELVNNGELTADEVVNCFAEALTGSHQYFQDTADIYEKLINAVISRYRNK
jgi:hypothetical protein